MTVTCLAFSGVIAEDGLDASETSSYTAATAPVINTSNDDVLTGDFLRVDIDGAGTGAKGLIVMVTLQPV